MSPNILKKSHVSTKKIAYLIFFIRYYSRALLPNATPLESRFFAEMSKKRQRCAVVNPENKTRLLQL
jgi:hypothetical protein